MQMRIKKEGPTIASFGEVEWEDIELVKRDLDHER